MTEEAANFARLTVVEAAHQLGITTEGVRARIKRGAYETQQGNDRRRRVLVPRSELARTDTQQHQTDAHEDGLRDLLEGELDRLASELERTRADVETWRTKAEQAGLEAARHEADHNAAERIIADLTQQRDRLADQLSALITDARRPFWRRWVGLVLLLTAAMPPQPAGAAESRLCPVRGASIEAAFEKCRAGDTVSVAVPAAKEASTLAARVCDFGKGMLVQRQGDKPEDGVMLACVYAGKIRPVAE